MRGISSSPTHILNLHMDVLDIRSDSMVGELDGAGYGNDNLMVLVSWSLVSCTLSYPHSVISQCHMILS